MKINLREGWHLLDADAVANQLHTGTVSGLSRGEARSRMRKYGKNTLFTIKKKSVRACLAGLISDPSLLLCLLVSCVAACFAKLQTAVTIWLILAASVAASTVISLQTARGREKMQLFSMPMARVVRDGKIYFTAAANLVPGDLILLETGDIVPADARIVRATGLTVSTVSYDPDTGEIRRGIPVSKTSDIIADGKSQVPDHENMIFGMSEITGGSGAAIVTATGKDTFLGAVGYQSVPDAGEPEPLALSRIHRFYHRYGTALLISVIPVTLIGMFFVKDADFLDLFLLALSLATSCMTGEVVSFAKLTYYHSAEEATKPDRTSDTLIFLNDRALDSVRKINEVILVGSAALHDGQMHAVALYAGGKIASGEDLGGEVADPLLCAAYQFFRGYFLSPAGDAKSADAICTDEILRRDYDGLYTLLHKIGTELDTVQLSSGTPYYVPPTGESGSLGSIRIATVNGTVTRHVSTDSQCIRSCAYYRVGKTRLPATSFSVTTALSGAAVYEKKHAHILYLYTEEPGADGLVFEGFLVFSPVVAKHIPELLYRFSEHHIHVTLFVGVEPDTRYYASFAGFGEPTSGDASRTAFRMIPAEDPAKSAKLYEDRLRAAGKRTLVLSVENGSLELIRGADIAVTCDPIRYDDDGFSDKYYTKLPVEGHADSNRAGQLMRTSSDILIRRSAGSHGGLHSIFAAFETSVSASLHMKVMLRYLACSQFLRAALVLTALFAGNPVVTAPIILISGLVVDVFAVLLIAYSRPSELPKPHPRPGMVYSVIAAIVTGIALYFFSMIPQYAGRTDAVSGQGCYLFLSVLLTQVCMFLVIYRIFCGRFRINALTGGFLLFFCTFIARGVTLGPIANFLGIGEMNLFRCAFLWCAPLLFLLLSLLLQLIFLHHRKN